MGLYEAGSSTAAAGSSTLSANFGSTASSFGGGLGASKVPALGDLIIVLAGVAQTNGPTSCTDSKGNVYTPGPSWLTSGSQQVGIFAAINAKALTSSDSATVTYSGTAGPKGMIIRGCDGVASATPAASNAAANTTGSTSPNSGSTGALTLPQLAIGLLQVGSAGGVPTALSFGGSTLAHVQQTGSAMLNAIASLTPAAGGVAASGTIVSTTWAALVAAYPLTSPAITTTLPGGTQGTAYGPVTLASSGGVSPITWAATGLPPGVTLAGAVLSGTPTAGGSYSVHLTATDAAGTQGTSTQTVIIQGPPLVISTASLPGGTVGAAYSAALAGSGGVAPLTWSATGLPSGLAVSGASITGTPAPGSDGTASVVLKVTDSLGTSTTKTLPLVIAPAPLVITTASLPGGTVGVAYSASLAASGGKPGYAWSSAGLPAGLAVSGSLITGTPLPGSDGTASVALTVTDSTSVQASKTLPLAVVPAPLVVDTTSLPAAVIGTPYSAPLAAHGGKSPYTWTATGLPAGLAVAGQQITGTPTGSPGTSTVVATAHDAASVTASSPSMALLVQAVSAPVITTDALPPCQQGTPYSATLAATGGVKPYTWTGTGLPPGLTVGVGQIFGTPLGPPGTSTVHLTVTDAASHQAAGDFALSVAPPQQPGNPQAEPVAPDMITITWGDLSMNDGDRDDGLCTVVTNVDGWYGSPPLAGNDLDRVLADGSVLGVKTLQARLITISGAATGPRDLLNAYARQLAAKAADRAPDDLVILEDDDSTEPGYLTASVRADSDSLTVAWNGREYFTWQVALTAADPRLYESGWSTAVLSAASSSVPTGRAYPLIPPRFYASADVPNTVRLVNPGSAPAPVWIAYTGPLGSSRLSDGTDSISLAALASAQQVLVNSETLTATAPGGASRASYVMPGSVPLLIPPYGEVSWSLYGTGAGTVTLSWRGAWA